MTEFLLNKLKKISLNVYPTKLDSKASESQKLKLKVNKSSPTKVKTTL